MSVHRWVRFHKSAHGSRHAVVVLSGYLRQQVTLFKMDFEKCVLWSLGPGVACISSALWWQWHADAAASFVWSLDGLLATLCCLSLTVGGRVALWWVHQGSLLQPWKIWGELMWFLIMWTAVVLPLFLSWTPIYSLCFWVSSAAN